MNLKIKQHNGVILINNHLLSKIQDTMKTCFALTGGYKKKDVWAKRENFTETNDLILKFLNVIHITFIRILEHH